jgi:hypothetical protein
MNEKLYETLEVCLQAIEAGADIESVLKPYPQMADELRPILEASQKARALAAPDISKDVMQRGRARVLGYASEMREAVGRPRRLRYSLSWLATSLALALIFVLSGTGLVRASSGALPGDELYPVKRTWEDVRLLLVFDDESRGELEDQFEDERVEEISELLTEGRYETVSFAGMVTEIDGDRWLVSGIEVLINPDTQLPLEPVTQGASIMVKGRTNVQGFVEAGRIELLEPGVLLIPFEAVEQENLKEADQPKNFESNTNDEEGGIKYPNNEDDNAGFRDGNDNNSEDAIKASGGGKDNGKESDGDKSGNDSNDGDSDGDGESDHSDDD